MNSFKRWAHSHRYAAGAAAGVLVILTGVTLANFFSGLPEAKEPPASLFYNPDPTRWGGAEEQPRTFPAFSERPLFSSTRRVKVPPPEVAPPPKTMPKSEPKVETLEGWSLLGIFDSGEVKGAFIRHANGESHRVSLGEQVEGWRLVAVDPRSVGLQSISGSARASLDMKLATVAVLPVPDSAEGDATGASNVAAEDETPAQPKEADLGVTFGNYYGGPPSQDD